MDHNQYLKKLTKCAIWKLGDLVKDARGAKKRVDNPTYPVELVELALNPTACEHCGRICDRPPTVDMRRHNQHWICKCNTCKLFKDPETNKFNLKAVSINAWMRKNR